MKKRKAMHSKTKTIGYGYVGAWRDGTLGWFLPDHLCGYSQIRDRAQPRGWNDGEPGYLCKITVQLVKDKRKRKIIRIVK